MIRAFIRDNPEIVRRYVRARLEAIAMTKTDRAMAIKALAKYPGRINNIDILRESYDAATPPDESPIRLELLKN